MGRVDTMITIPNDRLSSVVERKTTLKDAFRVADDVLRQGVQGISDIITIPGQINVDFADVRAVMSDAGPALMGIGYGVGDQRAIQAAQSATSSPLLEQTIHGAKGLLVNITSGEDLTLTEAAEAMSYIHGLCDAEDANIFFGTVVDPNMDGRVRITVMATGFNPYSREGKQATQAAYAPVVPEIAEPEPVRAAVNLEAVPLNRVSPRDIWEKAAAATREATTQSEQVFEDADLDIPAFIREHKGKN